MSEMLITKTAGCGTLGDWARGQGIWHPYTDTPQMGDLVLFDFTGNHSSRDHVGIYLKGSGTVFYAYEGNTGTSNDANGGAVMLRQRSIEQVVGWIRPRYTTTQTATRLMEIAASQVGITEYPANSNKVKYNTWFYGREVSGSAYPWCAAFVCWCFAVLAGQITDSSASGRTKPACSVNAALELVDGVHECSEGSVLSLQAILRAKGFRGKDGKELSLDGEWGENTAYALKTAQRAAGCKEDIECGGLSWAAIIKMTVKG